MRVKIYKLYAYKSVCGVSTIVQYQLCGLCPCMELILLGVDLGMQLHHSGRQTIMFVVNSFNNHTLTLTLSQKVVTTKVKRSE